VLWRRTESVARAELRVATDNTKALRQRRCTAAPAARRRHGEKSSSQNNAGYFFFVVLDNAYLCISVKMVSRGKIAFLSVMKGA